MTIEDTIAATVERVVREQLRPVFERLERLAPAPAPTAYLSVAEAARIASVAPDTVVRWIKAGRLQKHFAGRERRVRRDDLERFLAGEPESAGDLTPEEAVTRLLSNG